VQVDLDNLRISLVTAASTSLNKAHKVDSTIVDLQLNLNLLERAW